MDYRNGMLNPKGTFTQEKRYSNQLIINNSLIRVQFLVTVSTYSKQTSYFPIRQIKNQQSIIPFGQDLELMTGCLDVSNNI
jgi:hypothetical protein